MDIGVKHDITVIRARYFACKPRTVTYPGIRERTNTRSCARSGICLKWVSYLLPLRDLPHWPVRPTYYLDAAWHR
jgi:hypothetical protein